jgi:hypothetical protein
LSPDGAQLVALGVGDDDARGLPCRSAP